MAARGRPPRAAEPSTERVELRLTLTELRAVRAMAAVAGVSIADLLRLNLLDMAHQSGDEPAVAVRRQLAGILAGSKSGRVFNCEPGDPAGTKAKR